MSTTWKTHTEIIAPSDAGVASGRYTFVHVLATNAGILILSSGDASQAVSSSCNLISPALRAISDLTHTPTVVFHTRFTDPIFLYPRI